VRYILSIRTIAFFFIGSPADDYKNFYTARMLLLLESQFLYNEELFNKCVEEFLSMVTKKTQKLHKSRAPDKLRICVFYAMKTSKNACIIRSEC
jgi:hypothetical protein